MSSPYTGPRFFCSMETIIKQKAVKPSHFKFLPSRAVMYSHLSSDHPCLTIPLPIIGARLVVAGQGEGKDTEGTSAFDGP